MIDYLLSIIIFLPVVLSPLFIIPHSAQYATRIGLTITTLVFILCIYLTFAYISGNELFQFQEKVLWISSLDVYYHLAVDGLSIALILLTSLITVLVLVVSLRADIKMPSLFVALLLIMEGLMIGVFCARDVLLFYLFFEAMLIPMYLLIGLWGGAGRILATLKFFLYTLFGSIFFLIALIYLGIEHNSFDLATLQSIYIPFDVQVWILCAFLLAFGIKIPMWPVHTWLPHAHVEAPTAGSVILAAITLKVGGYGMLRFMLSLAPNAAIEFAPFIITLSLIAITYIGYVAIAQSDAKKLIAYSSIAHMGFVTLGLIISLLIINDTNHALPSTESLMAMQGAIFQMISHGLISSALFFAVGILYIRTKSRNINDYGGIASIYPYFSTLIVLFALANCGLPGTSGFVGEFFIILSSFSIYPIVSFFAATTLILGAIYSLWMIKRVIFGKVVNQKLRDLSPLLIEEKIVLGALGAGIIFLGINPDPLLLLTFESSQAISIQIIEKLHGTY